MYEIEYRSPDELIDSRIEWIGLIPGDWHIKKMRYLANIDTGNKDTQDRVEDGLYPFYVRSDVVERINLYSYDGEAILTAGDGVGVGRVFHYALGKFAFHQRVYKLSNFTNILGKYLYYYISENFHKEVMKLSARSTVDSLRRPMFSNFPVVFSDLKEQHKIVNFLDTKITQFNTIISKKEHLIQKLEEAKKSLISEVVTGKVKIVDGKLVEREPSEMKDSGVEWLGMIPNEWKLTKFKYVSTLNKRTLSNNESKKLEIKYIDIGNVDSNGNVGLVQEYTFDNSPSRARRVVEKYDVIVSTVRTYLKAIAYIDQEHHGHICSTGFAVISPNKRLLNPEYCYYTIQSQNYVDQIVRRSVGVSYPAINGSEIMALLFALPEINEQEYMIKFLKNKVESINEYIDSYEKQIDLLKQAKQSLISEAVTGKIDLRDWEIIEEGELQ